MIQVDDPQRDLIDPAVKGTRHVLASVIKHKETVRRVIVTSSVAGRALLLSQASACSFQVQEAAASCAAHHEKK